MTVRHPIILYSLCLALLVFAVWEPIALLALLALFELTPPVHHEH